MSLRTWRNVRYRRVLVCLAIVMFLSGCAAGKLFAQRKAESAQKLPSAEKIIAGYLKAIGGKKRVASIRDATLEWTIELQNQNLGTAKTIIKAPASVRSEMTFGNGQIISAANTSSAWIKGLDGELHTLTGPEAGSAKLTALLAASHLVDYKKLNVAARTISGPDMASLDDLQIEFSTRGGGKTVYSFSRRTSLITSIKDKTRQTTLLLFDYRPEAGILEPHRLEIELAGSGKLSLLLQRAIYNKGISNSTFDAPPASESLDVVALLREVGRNQDAVEKRFTEYAFLQKEADREINDRGEVKKETVKVSEVFPIANREPIFKLISENGAVLTGERRAKEERRVQEEFLKAERDHDKNEQRDQRRRAERQRKRVGKGKDDEDDDLEISQFLKVCEFVSPRRERFRDRDSVVFDFRARTGFKPGNRQEDLISKLVGVVWIDRVDKQVMRLEARLAEGFKMAGGLLLSVRPGAALIMEQTRMEEGVWLPRLVQINLSVKVLLFGGGDVNKTIEWSDYKHFKGDVGDYKLDAPKSGEATDKKP